MDQPTQPIPSHDPPSRCQNSSQLPAAQDQRSIQHLPANRAHPPLRVGVRPWCPHRRAQHPDPLGSEDRVERGGGGETFSTNEAFVVHFRDGRISEFWYQPWDQAGVDAWFGK
jgi:hypothetical protein